MSQDRSLDIKFACSYTISLSLMHLQMCTYYYSNPLHSYRNSMQRVEYLSTCFFINFNLYPFYPLSFWGVSDLTQTLLEAPTYIPTVGKIVPPVVPAALKTIDVEVPVWQ